MKVDVIIPVYKPGKELITLIERLERQTMVPGKIILMNTEEKHFLKSVSQESIQERYGNIEVYHINKKEFDHARTRRQGVKKSEAEVFVMMTQDAMPSDCHLIEHLVNALKEDVAVSYARQLPKENCSFIEKYTRSFNYPEQSRVKSMDDLKELGIKTYFCSNVCAAYRRDIYEKLGGFVRNAIFNEDMIYAAGALKAGYKVAYEAKAQVIHSHNYTCSQQFHRNFDLGVSQAEHPEVFAGIKSESEGKKMILKTAVYLRKNGRSRLIPLLFMQTAAKYAGYLLGKHYRFLPGSWVVACSDNKDYWK